MTRTSIAALPKGNDFVRHIDELINACDKTQRQIAYEIGYDKPNIITMFKQGTTRVPLDKVPALAAAIDTDATDLVRRWLAEYEPSLLEVLENSIGMALSRNERSWVANIRRTFKGGVPPWGDVYARALSQVSPEN